MKRVEDIPAATTAHFSPAMHGLQDCFACGATVSYNNRKQHEAFHQAYINRLDVGDIMSLVAWCDPGSHAFKAGEPGSIAMDGTGYDKEGRAQSQRMDMCARHNPQNIEQEVKSYGQITTEPHND